MVVVTSILVKNYFPLIFSFLAQYQNISTQLVCNETDFVRYLFSTPSFFRSYAIYLRLFHEHLVQSRVT